MLRTLRFVLLLGLPTGAAAWPAQAQTSPAAVDTAAVNGLLSRLVGDWRMTGEVRGEPVVYSLAARRVLDGRYVELHMLDAGRPARSGGRRYEARVFIGADTTPGRVIAHWLDSFGAAYSVPAATGSVSGDTLRFEFAYPGGPFRDTFVYDSAARSWSFLLEAGDGKGGWKRFADYVVRRAPAAPLRAPRP